MYYRLTILLVLATFIFASCKDDEQAKYEGIWEGVYAGDESGTWKIRIDEEGTSQGVAYPSDSEDQSFIFIGAVDEDGELRMTATVFGRVAIYEAFLTETNLTGEWHSEEGNFDGTWTGTKRERDDNFPYGLILNP
jgi:hypothetical protein